MHGDGPVLAHGLQQGAQLVVVVPGGARLGEQLAREAQVVSQVLERAGDAAGGLVELRLPIPAELLHERLPVALDEPHGSARHAGQGDEQQEEGGEEAVHGAGVPTTQGPGQPFPQGQSASVARGPPQITTPGWHFAGPRSRRPAPRACARVAAP